MRTGSARSVAAPWCRYEYANTVLDERALDAMSHQENRERDARQRKHAL